MNEKQIRADERKKWADWIGNVLPIQYPGNNALLWGISEAIENNNFGVIAKPQSKPIHSDPRGTRAGD